jgi:alpha-amylase
MHACSHQVGVHALWVERHHVQAPITSPSQGQLYNLTSKYGNQEQLQDLNGELRKNGIAPCADIVINHRCACEQVWPAIFSSCLQP